MNTQGLENEDGVWISGNARIQFQAFESAYLQVRAKEQRVFSIEQIKQLPEVPNDYIHSKEWRVRRNSIERFEKYLNKEKAKFDSILDIGCGNGFFTNLLSKYSKATIGADINLTELKQARTAFAENKTISWCCIDVMNETCFSAETFDMITFCCSFQYFENAEKTMRTCLNYLKPQGKIFIIDTPFYETYDIPLAKKRTEGYYKNLGMAELSTHYHHHDIKVLNQFNSKVIFERKGILQKILGKNISPFPCIEISK